MQRIVIRHISGPRANQVQEFPAGEVREAMVGRDPDAPIRFDPNDDLVSRQHARIVRDPQSPAHFCIVDLQSRNGTFLNRQRILASTRLTHGDVIQLGPAGPEFRFELDPAPLDVVRATRLADTVTGLIASRPGSERMPLGSLSGFGAEPRPIGRATVGRMLGDTFGKLQHESNKAVWMGAAVLAAVLVVSAGAYIYMRKNAEDAARQAARGVQAMAQLGQDLKKTPEAAESLRQELLRLKNELALAEARNAEQLRGITRLVASQRKERERAGAAAEPSRASAASTDAPAVGRAATGEDGPTAGASDASAAKVDYEAGVSQAVDYMRNNNAPAAERLLQLLIQQEPGKWQAYSVAGSLAKLQGNTSQAKSMFEKALSLAPEDAKPGLQEAIRAVSQ